jgi:hypothetical protein
LDIGIKQVNNFISGKIMPVLVEQCAHRLAKREPGFPQK